MSIGFQFYKMKRVLLSILLGVYPEVELLDHIIILFLTLEEMRTVFRSGYTILDPHQQRTSVLILPHPQQHLFSEIFSHPNGSKAVSHCREICVSLTASDGHLFLCLLATCLSLEEGPFKSTHFQIQWGFLL